MNNVKKLSYYNLIESLCIKKELDLIIPSILNSFRLQKQIMNIKDEILKKQIIMFFTDKINILIEKQKKLINNNTYNCDKKMVHLYIILIY